MSEKALHEFRQYRVVEDELGKARLIFKSMDGSWHNVTCAYGVEAELARLAARVAELEGENAKLRACVKAADARRLALSVHEQWETWKAYDAARAELAS